ncbi:hypothetical protein Pmani_027137 [Petrolisthes manimaculis]|uniref:Lipocalin/cytosolic fatty-acid binding domain-containing protein n=1 Tax=Petrolisthes manimaculis TaxID=1843537 RepID=A0AAE1P2A0_9EUCA|nr:hypothetical protein Pmani_027137 [Petrolisthes manimaculis]
MRVLLVSLLCLVLGVCVAQDLVPGRCPEFVPMVDFEIPPYLGKWYEIARFTTEDQMGQTCNYAEYSDNGDGTVGVHNAGLEADGNFTEIFGYVEPTEVSGALILHLDGVPVAGDYNVLATDYTTYTSVFSCVNVLGFHVEQAWVLAREPSISQEMLDTAYSAYTQWGVNVDNFQRTPQDNCVYL